MALTFPLPQAAFFAGLPVAECRFHLPASLNISRTRGGAIKTARMAERLWTGQLVLPPRRYAEAARIEALISALSEPGRSFLAHPLPITAPIADPQGLILGGATPSLHSVVQGGREIRVAGLPEGYVLTPGDMLGVVYGSNPTRYGLHRLVSGATATGAGITPVVEVTPPLRPGVAAGAPVSLVRPAIKAVLIPGQGARVRPGMVEGIVLDFVQTLG
ncbi:hypothetical protein C4N9_18545 [Pararhodobacter marinus]|uniref:Uncharacterized protein n=1 Tax=Pararhodobacter marinus TaxID=2184063 RepID=A0A2U2C539_9RHOB|nr:hypothetical protein [Pararhodobacter marinus]PWE27005.1 hypothetical protein C4N9_18545 [Pararhodobacter marinus]